MGSRIAVLDGGKLQQVGAPLELYERPQNVFVANFIGTPPMNFFKTTAVDGVLKASSFSLPSPVLVQAGRQVVVGVRPEHVLDAARTPRGPAASLELTVDLVETLGDEVIVHGHAGDETIAFKMDPHRPPSIGDRVAASLELDRLHVFDAGNGQRISSDQRM